MTCLARWGGLGLAICLVCCIGADWPRELKRLQTFGRLASTSPDEGQGFVDAPQAWREVAGEAGQGLHWLEEESGPQTTLQRLGRARRLAA